MTGLRFLPGILAQQQAGGLDKAGLIAWKVASGADHFWLFDDILVAGNDEEDQIGTMDLRAIAGSLSTTTGPTAAFTSAAVFTDDSIGHQGVETLDINQDFTFGFWIKTTDTLGIILSGYTDSNAYWYLLLRDSPVRLKWQLDPPSQSGGATYSSGVAVADNSWHYVHVWREYSATAASDIWGFAVDDGTPVTTARSAFSSFTPNAAQVVQKLFVGGQSASGVKYAGALQHLSIWLGKVLSAGERTTDYEAEQGTPPP